MSNIGIIQSKIKCPVLCSGTVQVSLHQGEYQAKHEMFDTSYYVW